MRDPFLAIDPNLGYPAGYPPDKGNEALMNEILEALSRCTECGTCLETCPTYEISQRPELGPLGRVAVARDILEGREPTPVMVEGMYSCPKCMQCEAVCPEEIPVTRAVHLARAALARTGAGPLPGHEAVMKGLMKTRNAAGGDPARRLDWLDGPFPEKTSDTLLYMGCLPSFVVKNVARSTYEVLTRLGADFTLLKDEGCCGTFLYECGRVDLAKEWFTENVKRFEEMGIRRIVAPCNGCYKCFKYFYPDLLGETPFTVVHALEWIYELVKENPGRLQKAGLTAAYQDPCRLSRGEGITDMPRELLALCGVDLKDPANPGAEAPCCGAGAGVRTVYRDLSLEMGARTLAALTPETVVTACPFCTFSLGYASKKREMGKRLVYFAEVVLDALGDPESAGS